MRRDRLEPINTLIEYRREFAERAAVAPKPALLDQLAKIDARLAQYAGIPHSMPRWSEQHYREFVDSSNSMPSSSSSRTHTTTQRDKMDNLG
jgi:hypothetical protein